MLKSSPRLGLLDVLSTELSVGACLCVKLVGGFGSALRRLAPSEPVAVSSERVSYSSGAAASFRSFLSEVGPSVARLASRGAPSLPMRRELLFSKGRGTDTGWGWEGGPVAAAGRLSGGKGSPRGVTEEFILLCSSGGAFPLSSPDGRGDSKGVPLDGTWGSYGSASLTRLDTIFANTGAAGGGNGAVEALGCFNGGGGGVEDLARGSPRDVTEEFVLLCSSGGAFPLSSPVG